MENRIKEQFSLFADRVSAETMRANQLRLYFSVTWRMCWSADYDGWDGGTQLAAERHDLAGAVEDRGKCAPECAQGMDLDGFRYPYQGLFEMLWLRLRL